MKARVGRSQRNDRGMTTVEYAIAGGLISGAVIAALVALGGNIQVLINALAAAIGDSPILS